MPCARPAVSSNFHADTSKLKPEIQRKIRRWRFLPCKIELISDLSPSSKTFPKTGREEAKVRLEIARATKFMLEFIHEEFEDLIKIHKSFRFRNSLMKSSFLFPI